MISLSKAETKKVYKVAGFNGDFDGVTRRLLELGFSVGQSVKVVATSLQKKVFLIELRGYILSVRASLLDRVQVQA